MIDGSNPKIVVNGFKDKFGGHNFLKLVELSFRPEGKVFVKARPIVNAEEATFWEIMKGKGPEGEAMKTYEELLESGCHMMINSGRADIREGVFVFPQEPKNFAGWFLNSKAGMILEIVQELENTALTLEEIRKKKDMSEQQMQSYIARGGLDDFISKQFGNKVTQMMELVERGGSMKEKKLED